MTSARINLADIALFVEVARQRSFSKAADALDMPVSSLSRRIAQLERGLGVTLMHRNSRRIELTEPGQRYYERCVRIVDDVAAAQDELAEGRSFSAGRLRMSLPVDFGLLFVAPAVESFARLHPGVTFEIDMSPQRVDLVAEHFDVAIRVGDVDDSPTLIARRLATVHVGLYAAPAYLAKAGTPARPDELERHDCLRVLLPGSARHWALHSGAEKSVVHAEGRFEVNNLSMLRQLTLAGCGVGAFDAVVADEEIRSGRLLRVLPEWSLAPLAIHALTPDRRLPARVRDWIDFVAERLRCFDCDADPASDGRVRADVPSLRSGNVAPSNGLS